MLAASAFVAFLRDRYDSSGALSPQFFQDMQGATFTFHDPAQTAPLNQAWELDTIESALYWDGFVAGSQPSAPVFTLHSDGTCSSRTAGAGRYDGYYSLDTASWAASPIVTLAGETEQLRLWFGTIGLEPTGTVAGTNEVRERAGAVRQLVNGYLRLRSVPDAVLKIFLGTPGPDGEDWTALCAERNVVPPEVCGANTGGVLDTSGGDSGSGGSGSGSGGGSGGAAREHQRAMAFLTLAGGAGIMAALQLLLMTNE